MTGRKNTLTLFNRTLPATVGFPTSTIASNQHLQVIDIEHDVCLNKNYCITVRMQNISSIRKLILKKQQILGSHEMFRLIFEQDHPKNH